jgi:glycosyltransferase involved in cell wall biosynthesis
MQHRIDPIRDNKALFVGCAKDCAKTLPSVLRNIERMSELFGETAFIFVENDSRDSTKQILQLWCGDKPEASHVLSLDGLSAACSIRTVRLEIARNRYLSMIQSRFRHYDLVFVLDCDDVNTAEIDVDAVRYATYFLKQGTDYAGVFANSEQFYYDLWALRHAERCPADVWEEACDYVFRYRVSDDEAFDKTFSKRLFSLHADAPPLEVDSAFGGFAIYKVTSVLRNKRRFLGYKKKVIPAPDRSIEVGWQCCEHVAFNNGFRELGERLFVLPYLINHRDPSRNFHPSAWRTLAFPLAWISTQIIEAQKIGHPNL